MAEEVLKSAEFTGMKKNDGEDPIIVAQRFLNIFKQLHIFSDERKENFNKMLLDLSPEIRGMFASLPGGSLLQEYVDDLENKSGQVRNKSFDQKAYQVDPSEKILETALKEANEFGGDEGDYEYEYVPQSREAGNVSLGANFAKELANAFAEAGIGGNSDLKLLSQALQINEEGRKKETAEITQAITDSQMKLAQMLVQNNTQNNNANNIQIHTVGGGNMPPMDDMVKGIVKAQSELFSSMAKTQTQELSSLLTLALKESHQLSTKSIIDALTAFQRENMKILGLYRENEPGAKTEAEPSMPPVNVFNDQKTEVPFESDGFLSKRDKKKKNKKKNREEAKVEEPISIEESSSWGFSNREEEAKFALDQSLFDFDEKLSNILKETVEKEEPKAEAEAEVEEAVFEPEPEEVEAEIEAEPEEAIEPAPEVVFEPEKKKKAEVPKDKLWNAPSFSETTLIDKINEPIDLEKKVSKEEKELGWGFAPKKAEEEEEWEWQEVQDDSSVEDILAGEEDEAALNEEEISAEEGETFLTDEQENEAHLLQEAAGKKPADEAIEFKLVDKDGVVDENYGLEDGQEWDYEEVPSVTEAGNEDWEWDYEEVPEGAEDGNEDWEWDYEEVPEEAEAPQVAPQPVKAEAKPASTPKEAGFDDLFDEDEDWSFYLNDEPLPGAGENKQQPSE